MRRIVAQFLVAKDCSATIIADRDLTSTELRRLVERMTFDADIIEEDEKAEATASAIEAHRAEPQSGSVHESAVPTADAQTPGDPA